MGSFTNYVYKKRWVGSPKMSTFIRYKLSTKGGRRSKKAKNLSTQFVNGP